MAAAAKSAETLTWSDLELSVRAFCQEIGLTHEQVLEAVLAEVGRRWRRTFAPDGKIVGIDEQGRRLHLLFVAELAHMAIELFALKSVPGFAPSPPNAWMN